MRELISQFNFTFLFREAIGFFIIWIVVEAIGYWMFSRKQKFLARCDFHHRANVNLEQLKDVIGQFKYMSDEEVYAHFYYMHYGRNPISLKPKHFMTWIYHFYDTKSEYTSAPPHVAKALDEFVSMVQKKIKNYSDSGGILPPFFGDKTGKPISDKSSIYGKGPTDKAQYKGVFLGLLVKFVHFVGIQVLKYFGNFEILPCPTNPNLYIRFFISRPAVPSSKPPILFIPGLGFGNMLYVPFLMLMRKSICPDRVIIAPEWLWHGLMSWGFWDLHNIPTMPEQAAAIVQFMKNFYRRDRGIDEGNRKFPSSASSNVFLIDEEKSEIKNGHEKKKQPSSTKKKAVFPQVSALPNSQQQQPSIVNSSSAANTQNKAKQNNSTATNVTANSLLNLPTSIRSPIPSSLLCPCCSSPIKRALKGYSLLNAPSSGPVLRLRAPNNVQKKSTTTSASLFDNHDDDPLWNSESSSDEKLLPQQVYEDNEDNDRGVGGCEHCSSSILSSGSISPSDDNIKTSFSSSNSPQKIDHQSNKDNRPRVLVSSSGHILQTSLSHHHRQKIHQSAVNFDVISHSYGTAVHGILIREYRQHLNKVCMIDPITVLPVVTKAQFLCGMSPMDAYLLDAPGLSSPMRPWSAFERFKDWWHTFVEILLFRVTLLVYKNTTFTEYGNVFTMARLLDIAYCFDNKLHSKKQNFFGKFGENFLLLLAADDVLCPTATIAMHARRTMNKFGGECHVIDGGHGSQNEKRSWDILRVFFSK